MSNIGKVFLIGAGCGEYDLITLRGMNALSQCDVVIYDSLIDIRLLKFAPENAEKIYVGKRAGHHSASQDEINKLLAEKALASHTVARLKGGDPFVFGRGGEEICTLKKHKIPYDIIPGISSCTAAAELAGIPVTHRGMSRSFCVSTGHTSEDLLPENLQKLASLGGTLVFLMGLKNLRKIAEGLLDGGMSPDTPSAVISKSGSPECRIVRAPLANIADETERTELHAPAVIVIGETAAFDLSPTYRLPLHGISVTLTGTEKFQEKLARKLETLGAEIVETPPLALKECADTLLDLSDYSALALTSPNGAEIFLRRLKALRIDIRILSRIKIAVIGKGTAAVLESIGVYPDMMPERFNTNAFGKLLTETLSHNDKLLIFRSSEGSRELNRLLDRAGIPYDDIAAYSPVYADKNVQSPCATDYIIFSSAGAVKNFFGAGSSLTENVKPVCIGDIAAEKFREESDSDCIIPKESTSDGIVDLILEDIKI